ncbi:MAG: DUF2961 domain-containing protein [Phycisphaerae bacterium]|nr:DUF2961 domain-containing protein [Phycisphaerae bacterium]
MSDRASPVAAMLLLGLAWMPCQGQVTPAGSFGLSGLEQFDLLGHLRQGVRTYQYSSHDRGGGNGDLNNFLESVDGEDVLLDVKGPGCVCRIWFTSTSPGDARIRIYFDGAATPLVDMRLVDFFSGDQVPFLSPLVGNEAVSSGGYYCYVPMPFREGCRITTTSGLDVNYHNITYQRFIDATDVTTFTGQEDTSIVRALWSSAGTDPKSDAPDQVISETVNLPPGGTVTLCAIQSPGILQRIELTIPGLAPGEESARLLGDVRLRGSWDGASSPSVDAPLAGFFGSGNGAESVHALPVGIDGERLYCFFPMPFESAATLELVNTGDTEVVGVSYAVGYTPLATPPRGVGRFHAKWLCETPTSPEHDYTVLEETGAGHFVGVMQVMRSEDASRAYLEGDERIYVDGSSTPALYGTGTEDFYNGGWYFNHGPFSLPVHGNPMHEPGDHDTTSCYRFFLGDLIPFTSSIKVGIQHGGWNFVCTPDICSVAFYYKSPEPLSVLTDNLNVCDSNSEVAHGYAVTGQTWQGFTIGYYEGNEGSVLPTILDYGRWFSGSSEFAVNIAPDNEGVLIRRRMDYRFARQEARVYVDDDYAGVWYDAGSNAYYHFRDSEFMVPTDLTQGKTSITVRLEVVSEAAWTEYRYWIYSLRATPGAYRTLELSTVNETLGEVLIEPEPDDPQSPSFPSGTEVTLTGLAEAGKQFSHWQIFDPNFPGDANYALIDSNSTIEILMDANRQVTAVFKCGFDGFSPVLLTLLTLSGAVGIRRSRRSARRA